MTEQVILGALAVALGVALGLLAFVPYVVIAQRRHGRLSAARLLVAFAMLVYGVALWTYTLLPLPDPGGMTCAGVQLDPAQIVDDLAGGLAGNALANPAVMQVVLNVALFIPLGFFIRVMWDRGVVVSLIAGLGLSLLIELTQLTGVWGIYPCAYRVFDVDDLVTNTAGAVLGAVFSLALPRTWRVGRTDAADIRAPQPVTRWRRGLAMAVDWVSVYLIGTIVTLPVAIAMYYLAGRESLAEADVLFEALSTVAAFAVTGVVALTSGRTIGDHALQLAYRGGPMPELWARVLRFVGGIGGYQILTSFTEGANRVSGVFVVATIVLYFATRQGRGLPAIVSRRALVDAREPVAA